MSGLLLVAAIQTHRPFTPDYHKPAHCPATVLPVDTLSNLQHTER